MKRISMVFIAGALALAVVLGGVGGSGVALAQGPTTPTTPQQAPIHQAAQAFWQALANRLNVTLDTLTQAVRGAAKDVVAQAVTGGTLTQDQANTANSRIDQWQPGQGPGLPFFGERGRGGPGEKGEFGEKGGFGDFGHGGMMGGLDAAAKALNMTTADLMTELRSGKTLAAVAQAKGVSADTVKAAIVADMKAKVDAAQQAGKLTADQATQAKQRIDTEAANWDLSQSFGPGGKNGMPGMPGGNRGNRGGQNGTPNPNATPAPQKQ